MTRRELMARLGNDEFKEWLAVERIYPFEDGYWQAAQIAFTTARAAGAKGVKFEHFLPQKAKAESRPATGIRVGAGVLDRIRRAKSKHAEA
ncbi:hypothetical protein SAMN05444166_1871 [Singulisphaera sp. GP187]|uniref:phage tail assembly protein T n=1 Tax=Singulisphaera sp. GP187 TaxID=1882752 RepID=UPI00092ABD7B|nr:hypothetical protein [Singulisphaera sp. GP187]SIN97647.1 hypothetical protein SAMN05444166_1871 [Singulisphaera sp. GP187]